MKSAIRKIRRRRILATQLVWRRLRAMRAAYPYLSDDLAADMTDFLANMGELLARLETRLSQSDCRAI